MSQILPEEVKTKSNQANALYILPAQLFRCLNGIAVVHFPESAQDLGLYFLHLADALYDKVLRLGGVADYELLVAALRALHFGPDHRREGEKHRGVHVDDPPVPAFSLKCEHVRGGPRVRLDHDSRVEQVVGLFPDVAVRESVALFKILFSVHLQTLVGVLLDLQPFGRQRELRFCAVRELVRVRGPVLVVLLVVGAAQEGLLLFCVHPRLEARVELRLQVHQLFLFLRQDIYVVVGLRGWESVQQVERSLHCLKWNLIAQFIASRAKSGPKRPTRGFGGGASKKSSNHEFEFSGPTRPPVRPARRPRCRSPRRTGTRTCQKPKRGRGARFRSSSPGARTGRSCR